MPDSGSPSPADLALELTGHIPVGVFVLHVDPQGQRRFTFVSERWLTLLDIDRETALNDYPAVRQRIHPDDQAELSRLHAAGELPERLPFLWEGRIFVRGETRWMSIESVPRDRPGGGTIWEGVVIDITRRKVKSDLLRASEARLRQILDNIPLAIVAKWPGVEGQTRLLNARFVQTFGYTPGEIPTEDAWYAKAFPDAAYRQSILEEWARRRKQAGETNGSTIPLEVQIRHCNGSTVHAELSRVVLDDMHLISFVDITHRKQAETELRKAQDALEKTAFDLTENIPVGTYVVHFDDRGTPHFTFVSRYWLKMLDLEREAVLADADLAFQRVHPEDHAAFVRLNQEVLRHKSRFYWEGRMLIRGEIRWFVIESIPREQPGTGTLWEGVVTDITGRRKAEERLAQSEESLRRILNNLPIPIAVSYLSQGLHDRVEFLNHQFVRTFGYTLAEIPTVARWTELAYPEKEYRESVNRLWQQALKQATDTSGELDPMEFRITCKDGTIRHAHASTFVSGDTVLVALLDITARKEAETALEAARLREKESERKQRRTLEKKLHSSLTASAVAHEINEPLSTLLLHSKLAVKPGCNKEQALIDMAAETGRIVATIEKMRALLRNVETAHYPLDLAHVVRSALLQINHPLRVNQVRLTLSGMDQPAVIEGDDAQLQIAILNLLRNSLESMARSETRELSIGILRRKRLFEVVVGDSGPGWAEGKPAGIPLSTTKPGGTGLGLYIVRTAVNNHRARMAFGRSPLGGAEVRLIFRAAPAAKKPAGKRTAAPSRRRGEPAAS